MAVAPLVLRVPVVGIIRVALPVGLRVCACPVSAPVVSSVWVRCGVWGWVAVW